MTGPTTSALVAGLGATLILAVAGSSSPMVASSAGARQTGPTLSSAVSTANPPARVARPNRTWQRLPAAPIPAPYTLASVWTGSQMLIFGRVSRTYPARGFDVLAAYRPANSTWRRLPSGPGPKGESEGSASAVWTGKEMIVWGKANAAFSPLTGRRRALPASPIALRAAPTLVVWTGRQMIGWGGGCCGEAAADGAAYTPATNSGQKLANLPVPLEGAVAIWDGHEVLLVGGRTRLAGRLRLVTHGFAYNPATNRWRQLPAMGQGRIGQVAVWTGRQLLMWGGETLRAGVWVAPPHGVAYEPAHNRSSALPTSPLRGRISPTAVWTGRQMIVWGGQSIGNPTPRSLNDGAAYTP